MAGLDLNVSSTTCRKCGRSFGRLKGNFPVSYALLYKGTGYMPYCRECVDEMYAGYLSDCGDPSAAARQVCRKLDLYWNSDIFDDVQKMAVGRSVMTRYVTKINQQRYAGKCYDDTLREENALWLWPSQYRKDHEVGQTNGTDGQEQIDPEIVSFWGSGYTPDMYQELERRRQYMMSHLPAGTEMTIGLETLIRQICAMELDINRDRAAGKSVDKSVTALNTLLGSAMLKPAQKNDGLDASFEQTPFGVWINRWENERPIPDADPDLQDVDGVIKYILTWYYGHLAKMLGVKNAHSRLYDDEIERLRVAHPEYEDEDDESLLYDIFSGDDAKETDVDDSLDMPSNSGVV